VKTGGGAKNEKVSGCFGSAVFWGFKIAVNQFGTNELWPGKGF
jgi:hypothetical protein